MVFTNQKPIRIERKQNPYQIKKANNSGSPPLCHPLDIPIIKEHTKAIAATILYSNGLMS